MPARPIAPVLITIYVCIGTLQHANLRWTFGPVGRVLVSPAYHRLHHAPDIQDANLGVVLTVWDVLAGCARFPSRADSVNRTGLDGRPVPVEQEASAGPPCCSSPSSSPSRSGPERDARRSGTPGRLSRGHGLVMLPVPGSWRSGPDGIRAAQREGVPMPYRVVVVGAGFGGIGMAIALKQAGIEDFVVLDKADDLGGTWRDNSYPGLCCDVPSQLYSYSFRPWRWSRRFPPREEILAYLHGLVAERGLGPHLRFGAGVAAAEFDERRAVWNLTLDDGETLQATAVVCAVGQLGRPSLPDIAGRDEFAGPWWHSGALEPRRRPGGPAGGRDRHRGQRHPVRARDRQGRRARRRLPADRPVRAAQGRPAVPGRRAGAVSTGCPWCARPTGSASSSTASCSPAASSCRRSCWPGRCSCGAASSAPRSPTPSCAPSASPTT